MTKKVRKYYTIKHVQFCGEEKDVIAPASLKDGADVDLYLCSACKAQPQVMCCAKEIDDRWDKVLRKTVPVYCERGYCAHHDPRRPDDFDGRDMSWRNEEWWCHLHRPSKQIGMI